MSKLQKRMISIPVEVDQIYSRDEIPNTPRIITLSLPDDRLLKRAVFFEKKGIIQVELTLRNWGYSKTYSFGFVERIRREPYFQKMLLYEYERGATELGLSYIAEKPQERCA